MSGSLVRGGRRMGLRGRCGLRLRRLLLLRIPRGLEFFARAGLASDDPRRRRSANQESE